MAGGSEAAICPMGVGGFAAMKALSTRNDEPDKASRPFDRARDGFVIGEGAGILILEELGNARKRGARIYAEIIGYASTSDAYHITQPSPDGEGGARSMRLALQSASLNPDQVDYINAHGTSTPTGDGIEVKAIKTVFGAHAQKLMVSSTKSMTGHMLGAAGAVEMAVCAKVVQEDVVPPTANLDNPDEGFDLDFVPHQARQSRVNVALNNSFGFGGQNCSLVVRKFTG